MSEKTANKNPGVVVTKNAADDGPDDFISVNTDRSVYNMELCKDLPLRGYLLDSIQFGQESERPFKMFLIKLTAPTKCVDREKKLKECKAGDEVLIVATYALRAIEKLALHPQYVFEIWLKPIAKDEIPGGQEVWRVNLKVSPKSVLRATIAPQTLTLPTVAAPNQLPAGSNAEAPIPF